MASNRTSSINGGSAAAVAHHLTIARHVPPAPGSAAEAKLAAAMRPRRDLPPLPQESNSVYLSRAVGIAGMGAGFLYWTPAATCEQMAQCGQFVAKLIDSDEAAFWVLFSSGFLGYALSNAYFASKSVPTLLKHLQKKPHLRAQILSLITIGLYALSQIIPNYLLASGTESSFWSTSAMLFGAFPGALYTATEVVDKQLPKLLSEAGLRLLNRKEKFTLDEKRRKYYADAQKTFIKDMRRHFKSIVADFDNYEEEKNEFGDFNPLKTLMHKIPGNEEQQTPLGIKILSHALSIFLVDSFSTPIVLNTYDASGEHLWKKPAFQTFVTAVFSSSMVYNNLDVCNRGFTDLLETLRNALTGKPIDSAVFKLYPMQTIAAAFLALAPSIFSHSVVGLLWEKFYNGPAKNELRYAAWAGIDTYHAFALFQFFILILKLRSTHSVFELERKIEEWNAMTPEQFAEFVEDLTEEDCAQAFLHTYENRSAIAGLDPRIAEPDNIAADQALADMASGPELLPPPNESQWRVVRFFRSLCGGSNRYQVVAQQEEPSDIPAGRPAAPGSTV